MRTPIASIIFFMQFIKEFLEHQLCNTENNIDHDRAIKYVEIIQS